MPENEKASPSTTKRALSNALSTDEGPTKSSNSPGSTTRCSCASTSAKCSNGTSNVTVRVSPAAIRTRSNAIKDF